MELTTSGKEEVSWGSDTESTKLLSPKESFRKRKATKTRKLVVMLAGLVQQFISVGLGFGLSVMYPELINVFNEKRSNAALIQGLYLGLSVGCGIFITGVIKRVGPGITIIAGSVITTTGFFASSFAQNLPTIIVCTGVIGGLGMCSCYLSAFISISWMFHEDPGFPLVCLTVGSSVGQFVIPYLYEIFISEYGWSGAFILVSGLALQCAPFGLLIYTSKEYFVTDNNKQSSYSSVSDGYIALLIDKLLWILLLDFLLIALTGNVEAWFIVDIMMSRGYSRESGSLLVSALGLANFIGRISGSTLRFKCTTIPTVYHWLWICPIIACGHALVITMTDYWAIFAACIFQGAAFGTNNSQTPAIMFEASGLGKYPQAMSLVNVMYGIGNMFSNVIGGIIRDNFGEYNISFYIAIGSSLLITFNSAIASFIIHGRRKHFKAAYKSLE